MGTRRRVTIAMIQYGRRASSFSSPTILLLIANVTVFFFLVVGGDRVMYLLAQEGNLFFEEHYVWQLFSSMFVHFDLLHIAFNMYGLYYFGRLNESHFSTSQYLAIYFGSGLVGNVASLFLIPPDVLTGGASGAVFGLIGSSVVIGKRAQQMGMALIYAILIFVQSSGPGVNIFSHLFGLVGGLIFGLAFSQRRHTGYNVSYTFTG